MYPSHFFSFVFSFLPVEDLNRLTKLSLSVPGKWNFCLIIGPNDSERSWRNNKKYGTEREISENNFFLFSSLVFFMSLFFLLSGRSYTNIIRTYGTFVSFHEKIRIVFTTARKVLKCVGKAWSCRLGGTYRWRKNIPRKFVKDICCSSRWSITSYMPSQPLNHEQKYKKFSTSRRNFTISVYYQIFRTSSYFHLLIDDNRPLVSPLLFYFCISIFARY